MSSGSPCKLPPCPRAARATRTRAAAERLLAALRRKPLTPRRAAVIIASYTTLVVAHARVM